MSKEQFDDHNILYDMLFTQEYLSHVYQFSMREFTGAKLRHDWADLLSEELEMAFEVVDELQKRGWMEKSQSVSRNEQKQVQSAGEQHLSDL